MNEPVILRKTLIGGVFSSLFILFTIVTISFGLYIYSISNVKEIKTLIPTIIVDDKITAKTLSLTISLNSFSSKCIENGGCMQQKTFSESGFSYDQLTTTCKKQDDDCLISLKYSNLNLFSDGKIILSIDDVYAFTSSISLNISTSSSIPDQLSTIMLYESPSDNNSVLKGGNPSIFKFELIPSVNFI